MLETDELDSETSVNHGVVFRCYDTCKSIDRLKTKTTKKHRPFFVWTKITVEYFSILEDWMNTISKLKQMPTVDDDTR